MLSSVEIWSPRTGRFTPAAPLHDRRHKHAAVAVRGGVLVLGGSDDRDFAGRRSSAELYQPALRRWVRVGSLSAPRFKLGDAVVALPDGGALVAEEPRLQIVTTRRPVASGRKPARGEPSRSRPQHA